MKKALSVALSLVLIAGMLLVAPVSVSAATIEEMDYDDTMSAFFDFEDKNFMKVGSQSQNSEKVVWEIDPTQKLEYFYSAWGLSSIGANPVKDAVNSSEFGLQAKKTTYNNWSTGGGIVINHVTEKGVEPLVLDSNTTYIVEFDYIMASTHLYGSHIDPNDATNSITISEDVTDSMSFGYGYRTTTAQGLAPVMAPKTTVSTIATYKAADNEDGYYTAHDGTQKEVGKWVHASFTFTTGTFDTIYSITNAPFLVFYANMYTGAHMMIDNIRVSKPATVNFHAMEGTLSASGASGKVGTQITFPTATRYGYEFTGWYADGACSVPFGETVFTKAKHNATAFAGWTQDLYSFESYAPAGSSANNSKFAVSPTYAYSGVNSMKYTYSSGTVNNWSRENDNSYFTIRPLTADGKYKISFKYYIASGADAVVYPVTVGTSNSSSSGRKTYKTAGASITLPSSGAGRWQTASLVFTSTMSGSANNLGLHVHASSNTNTVVYIDDIKVIALDSATAIGALDVNGKTVGLADGDAIDNAFVYNGGYAVEGWYTDSTFTNKVPAGIYTTALSAVYPKFGDRVDLTVDGTATRTGGFAKADDQDLLLYNGASGTASLAQVNSGSKYMVEFLYKNNGASDVTLSAGGGSFKAEAGKADKWYKGYIPATASSTGALTLNAQGSSSLEIKNVYIKDLTGKSYIIFDSTEFGGEITAVYGEVGTAISFPANPIVKGMQFDGWYNGGTKFTATEFPTNSVSLVAEMTEGGEVIAGDCDGDGKMDAVDLAKLKLYLAKIDIAVYDGADINSDGKVNAIDLVLLHKKLAGQ